MIKAVAALFSTWFFAGAAMAGEAASHKVVSIDGTPEQRKLSVRIDQRLSETALKDLAETLRIKAKPGERIATIVLYLPGAELSGAPWAMAKFDGVAADVKVLGLRAEEEAAFRAEAQNDPRDVIGVWLTSPPALPGKLTLVRAKGGKVLAEWQLRSGQKTSDDVIASKTGRGQRFDIAGGDGAYYLVTWNGALELGDKTRVIAVAERMTIDKRVAQKDTAKDAAKTGTGKTEPGKPAALTESAAVAESGSQAANLDPVAATSEAAAKSAKPRRYASKSPAPRRAGSPVADLMGSSLAR